MWKIIINEMKNLVIIVAMAFYLKGQSVLAQVNTPNGVQVPPAALFVYKVSDYSDAQLQSWQNDIQNGVFRASCIVLSGYTRQYNCHGYAWHISTGGSQIGIDQIYHGGVTPYMAGVNPSYAQTNYNGTQGKLRVRYSGDHSAVTTYENNKFISKWGPVSLVKHNPNDVPPGYGVPATYWTCNYAPPLTSTYLDGKLISGSFQTTKWGAHNMQIFWGLDPDTGPTFSSTAGSTIITNQSSGIVNFNFSGPSNNGGLSIAFCGAPRYSFTFFKPSGAKMDVFPNPANDQLTVALSSSSAEGIDILPVNLDENVNKMVKISLLNERQVVLQEFLPSADGSQTRIKLNGDLRGTYYLKATFSDGTMLTKQVLVAK
jgi:hypothetical protein